MHIYDFIWFHKILINTYSNSYPLVIMSYLRDKKMIMFCKGKAGIANIAVNIQI